MKAGSAPAWRRFRVAVVGAAAAVCCGAVAVGCGPDSPPSASSAPNAEAGDGEGLAADGVAEDATPLEPAEPPEPAVPREPVEPPAPVSTRPPLSDPPDPGPVPDDHELTSEELDAAVASSVRISGVSCGIVREGSGFAVGDGDLIVTNAHVMVGLFEREVELRDGRKLAAVAVAFDPVHDLALLRAAGANLEPLPLNAAAPDGTVGAVLAWEDEGRPEPTPYRIDRPVRVITDAVVGDERIERPSWLLAANTESGDSGAALVWRDPSGRTAALGVAWGASRRGGVAYATRASAVADLLAANDWREPVDLPDCR